MKDLSDSLAKFLISARKDRSMTTTQLAELAGLTHASISRVETGRAAVTMFYLYRIFDALELPFSTLIELNLVPSNTPDPEFLFKEAFDPNFPTLQPSDLKPFFHLSPIPRNQILLKLFQEHVQERMGVLPDILINPTFADVRRILPIPDEYIFDIDLTVLRKVVAADGVLIPKDLGAWLYRARKRLGFSLRQVSDHVSLSHAGIRKLERDLGKRTRFVDIVSLDHTLRLNGEFIALSWKVFGVFTKFVQWGQDSENISELKRDVEYLVSISRLYQMNLPDNLNWPDRFRQMVEEQKTLTGIS